MTPEETTNADTAVEAAAQAWDWAWQPWTHPAWTA